MPFSSFDIYVDFAESSGREDVATKVENIVDSGYRDSDKARELQRLFVRQGLVPEDVDLGYVGKTHIELDDHAIFRAIERKPLKDVRDEQNFIRNVEDWMSEEARQWRIPVGQMQPGKVYKKKFNDGKYLLMKKSGKDLTIFGYQPREYAMAAKVLASIVKKAYLSEEEGNQLISVINRYLEGRVVVNVVNKSSIGPNDTGVDLKIVYVDTNYFKERRISYADWMAMKLEFIPIPEIEIEESGNNLYVDVPYKEQEVSFYIKLSKIIKKHLK